MVRTVTCPFLAAVGSGVSTVQWAQDPVGSSSWRVQEVVEVGDGASGSVALAGSVAVAVVVEVEEAGVDREGENRALFSAE